MSGRFPPEQVKAKLKGTPMETGRPIEIDIRVNKIRIVTLVPKNMTLLTFLRDRLKLTGAKNGCSTGHCGACSVLFNGELVRSCLFKMHRLDSGHIEIETIESLAKNGAIHPIQYAFIKKGAIQCGYCTPGMILAAKSLLLKKEPPTSRQIKSYLQKNRMICRCTGYVKIIEAIHYAAEILKNTPMRSYSMDEISRLTSAIPIADAIGRSTGRTKFADDLWLENMLHGKVLWSKYPRAEILKINTHDAESIPGVVKVLVAKDIPGKKSMGIDEEQPVLASDRVNYIGDPIAVVFAFTADIAKSACRRIDVEYNSLPGVFNVEEASAPDAPIIHRNGNLAKHFKIERGDISSVWDKCSAIVKGEFSAPRIEHAYLEPESGVAYPVEDGGVVVKIATHDVCRDRRMIAEILSLPQKKVRVVHLPSGGSFGGKDDFLLQALLALGALTTGRPVKITLSRKESLKVHSKRHPIRIRSIMGANRDGKIMALQTKIWSDTGPYSTHGPGVLKAMVMYSAGPYDIPNLHLEGWMWYTNSLLCGAMRAYGIPQVAAFQEQQVDRLASLLDIDPFDIRKINALHPGSPTVGNQVLKHGLASLSETLDAARKALSKSKLPPVTGKKKRGVGVACCYKHNGYGSGILENEGVRMRFVPGARYKILIFVCNSDFGSGMGTALIQLAASELKIDPDRFQYVGADTDTSPPGDGSRVSRLTFLLGNALLAACRELKNKIIKEISSLFRVKISMRSAMMDGKVISDSGDLFYLDQIDKPLEVDCRYEPPLTEPVSEKPSPLFGTAGFKSRTLYYDYSFNTQVAIIDIDVDTGEVMILKLISAIDSGKSLCLPALEGQIHGGAVMGIGYALSEKCLTSNGYYLTRTFGQCAVPGAVQVPEIISEVLEIPNPDGPCGAKGLGETTNIATAPAILNAIADAAGIRIHDLPAEPFKIRLLLQEKNKKEVI